MAVSPSTHCFLCIQGPAVLILLLSRLLLWVSPSTEAMSLHAIRSCLNELKGELIEGEWMISLLITGIPPLLCVLQEYMAVKLEI